jgi:hypothetical protein
MNKIPNFDGKEATLSNWKWHVNNVRDQMQYTRDTRDTYWIPIVLTKLESAVHRMVDTRMKALLPPGEPGSMEILMQILEEAYVSQDYRTRMTMELVSGSGPPSSKFGNDPTKENSAGFFDFCTRLQNRMAELGETNFRPGQVLFQNLNTYYRVNLTSKGINLGTSTFDEMRSKVLSLLMAKEMSQREYESTTSRPRDVSRERQRREDLPSPGTAQAHATVGISAPSTVPSSADQAAMQSQMQQFSQQLQALTRDLAAQTAAVQSAIAASSAPRGRSTERRDKWSRQQTVSPYNRFHSPPAPDEGWMEYLGQQEWYARLAPNEQKMCDRLRDPIKQDQLKSESHRALFLARKCMQCKQPYDRGHKCPP